MTLLGKVNRYAMQQTQSTFAFVPYSLIVLQNAQQKCHLEMIIMSVNLLMFKQFNKKSMCIFVNK